MLTDEGQDWIRHEEIYCRGAPAIGQKSVRARTLPNVWRVKLRAHSLTLRSPSLTSAFFARRIARKVLGDLTNTELTLSRRAWVWMSKRVVSPDMWRGFVAFVAFILVIWLFPQQGGSQPSQQSSSQPSQPLPFFTRDTWFPIAMGLLGSSVFLLYSQIRPKPEDDAARSHPLITLFLGPVAGWLAQNMVSNNKLGQQQIIWLPFLVGFSSDLLVGIINQMIKAIKYTLGIEQIPPNAPPASASNTGRRSDGG